MSNRMEEAIKAYAADQNPAARAELDSALIEEKFFVPIEGKATEIGPGKFNIPVQCVKTEKGAAIPAFTTAEQLLAWKPQGCDYTSLAGAALMAMAAEMTEVSEILINPAGRPRGTIPRSDFERIRFA